MIRTVRVAAVAAASALGLCLTACDGNGEEGKPPTVSACLAQRASLVLVVGARSNSPVPELPEEVKSMVVETADAGRAITLIRLDGEPKKVFDRAFTTGAGNAEARRDELNTFLATVHEALTGQLPAQAPEADVLGALTLAAQSSEEGATWSWSTPGFRPPPPSTFVTTCSAPIRPRWSPIWREPASCLT